MRRRRAGALGDGSAPLKPYGKDAHFANEVPWAATCRCATTTSCTPCRFCGRRHSRRDSDAGPHDDGCGWRHCLGNSVGCSHRTPTERDLFNVDAALPAGLPVAPLEWQVITSSIDREHHTMATLFGNGAAVTSARSAADAVTYPAGSQLALVTWVQRDDEHWFGGRIPQRFVSMELVTGGCWERWQDCRLEYEQYGPDGRLTGGSDQDAAREDAILAERASFMP